MKKIYNLLGILLFSTCLLAQSPANRTTSTIVADVLAQLPASDPKQYNILMDDLLSTKGEGVVQLVGMMKAPSEGANSKIEYALSGLAFYSANKSESERLTVSNGFLKALDTSKERESLAFVIRQIQMVSKDEAVDKLASYLNDDLLVEPAAIALAAIDSKKSGDVLLKNLLTATTIKQKQELVSALGFMGVGEAESAVKNLLNSGDEKLQQAVIASLSKIGSKASLKDMDALAKKENYAYDRTGATVAYINLIEKILKEGDKNTTEKAGKNLMKEAEKAKSSSVRQAALKIIMESNPSSVESLALKAIKDPCTHYRYAALRYAPEYALGNNIYSEIFKVFPKSSIEAKIDIARWTIEQATTKEKCDALNYVAYSPLVDALKTDNATLKQASAIALVKIADKNAIEPVSKLLNSDNASDIAIAKGALATCKGDITPAIVGHISTSSDIGKVAILELLALRKSSDNLNAVITLTNAESQEVKTAAYSALKDVVVTKDFGQMCNMLEAVDATYIKPVQDAVISTLKDMPESSRFNTLADKASKAPKNQQYLYYTALASTGDAKALALILDGFYKGDNISKDGAFDALLTWQGIEVADDLLAICKDANSSVYFDRSLTAYIKTVSNPSLTGENRLIYLREAMEIAKSDEHKNSILRQVQRTGTFLGVIFAGKYLDEKATQQSAAHAIMNIALANPDYTGDEVEALLNKVMNVLDNSDAEYQKEAIRKHLREVSMRKGYISIFNGKDLTGWKGLVKNPIERAKMSATQLSKEQVKADQVMRDGWHVENGQLIFKGKGDNICTDKKYADFEMYVDWKLDPAGPEADAGVYLRGTPQVQIWDISRVDVGAQVGSGGLYNNQKNTSVPAKVADNKLGDWNTFYIKMMGDRVTVILNGELVVDNVIMENYWNRSQPIPFMEQLELQAHGSKVYYRDIYVKELEIPTPFELSAEEKKEGFQILFDGTNMHQWTGNTVDYILEEGCISMHPSSAHGGNLYTKEEYENFDLRFEFQLTPGANNGLGIRTPMEGDAAYVGMELQILDYENPIYSDITPLQVHGSVYGILGAKREGMKPVGEWNYQEVIASGDKIKVILNGVTILDGNIRDAVKAGTADGKEHPGLFNQSGHIAFLGHGSPVKFRDIRIKLKK